MRFFNKISLQKNLLHCLQNGKLETEESRSKLKYHILSLRLFTDFQIKMENGKRETKTINKKENVRRKF